MKASFYVQVGLALVTSVFVGSAFAEQKKWDITMETADGTGSGMYYVGMTDSAAITDTSGTMRWSFVAPVSGTYTVIVTDARGQGPSTYAVSVGSQTLTGSMSGSPNWNEFFDDIIGTVTLVKDTTYDVSIKGTAMPPSGTMIIMMIRRITLRPAGSSQPVLQLHGLFRDNAVFQRNMTVPVWGNAGAGEAVTVSFAGQSKNATADSGGLWKVLLDPMNAGGPYTMTVSGSKTITATNILIGEVWVNSGQSNARMTLDIVQNGSAEVAAANYPQIRRFTVPIQTASAPQTEITAGSWKVCSPQTANHFPAFAYFFARELYTTLNVPVGIINSSVGATPAEHWSSQSSLEADPLTASLVGQAKDPTGNWPTSLYNGMIAPLMPYAIRGAIWYQAESNTGRQDQYKKLFPNMIKGWRNVWGLGDFYFGFVQLPNCGLDGLMGTWASMRDAQTYALALPNVGMAVAIDVGVDDDTVPDQVHAPNKQDVGKRMALWAEHDVYGMDIVYYGPFYREMSVNGNKLVLSFDHTGSGLVTKGGGAVTGFTIAGADKNFVTATANIEGDKVSVWNAAVAAPVEVRYAWSDNPTCNLYNVENLPAAPFQDNRNSIVKITKMTEGRKIYWQSTTERSYSVYKSTNLLAGWEATPLTNWYPGMVGGTNMFDDATSSNATAFYKIKTQQL